MFLVFVHHVSKRKSTSGIILASLPSFCQKLSKLVQIWRTSDKNNFARLFLRHDVVFCFLTFGCQYQCNQLPGKTRLQNGLLCVMWDVKPNTLTHFFCQLVFQTFSNVSVLLYISMLWMLLYTLDINSIHCASVFRLSIARINWEHCVRRGFGVRTCYSFRWLGGLVVRMLDSRLAVRFTSRSWHCLVISEIGYHFWWVNYLGCKHQLGQLRLASLWGR